MKFDGIHYYGADADPTFENISSEMQNCPNLKTYHICQRCPRFAKCDDIFTHMSGRSVRHGNLKPADVSFYRQQFLEGVGIVL